MLAKLKMQTRKIQLEKLSWYLFRDIFDNKDKEELIVLIYDRTEFIASVTLGDFQNIYSEADFWCFCKYEMVRDWCECDTNAEKLFDIYKSYRYILAENPKEVSDFCEVFGRTAVLGARELENIYYEMNDYLKSFGVASYIVQIPTSDDIPIENRHMECNFWLSHGFNWTGKDSVIKDNCRKISNRTYEDMTQEMRKHHIAPEILGKDYDNQIFLAGPCIVNGQENFQGESLMEILHQLLEEMNICYKLVKVYSTGALSEVTKKILEYNIKKNDIVIFMDSIFKKYDLNLSYLYNKKQDKWLYMDEPIHSTRYGNELISEALVSKIIRPNYEENCVEKSENTVLYQGERQISNINERDLAAYVSTLSAYKKQGENLCGAIVMNCNPFTLGHRYLIEYASGSVDVLYIFVVEEDSSMFSFEDRICLVKEGVKDLENVIVISSGRVIISRDTFQGYFNKKNAGGYTDASKDIFIFGKYIAPALNIRIRFVGTEPSDEVTRSYNEQLKQQLPEYGIELMEIERRRINGLVISASTVRQFFLEKDWHKISELVSKQVLCFLQTKAETVENKDSDMAEKCFGEIIRFMEEHERVIWYGTGKNAEILIERMGDKLKEKILFCDKNAEGKNYAFHGKKVLDPSTLYLNCKDDYIFITSPVWGREIFRDLFEHGFDPWKIMCNRADWAALSDG